ncbi:hypothetical protein [Microbacterium sp.]|uniref:hypothetical protein n=1 Tax=Microbacterium sp. TaxID=51671 RepID=UPI003A95193A
MTTSGSGFPRGRIGWIAGSVVLLVAGALVGAILGSVWLGLFLALIVSLGWVMAYESWRGRSPHLHDEDDDGARL